MKIENPIDERLWKALNHVTNFANMAYDELGMDCETDWKYADGLEESIALVSEYASCFAAYLKAVENYERLNIAEEKKNG